MRSNKILVIVALCLFANQIESGKLKQLSCDSKFCEEDPSYPEQLLNSLDLWKLDFNSEPLRNVKSSGTFFIEAKLCESKTSLLRPRKLKNAAGKLRTIVNHLNYTQVIRFETCSSENFPCTYNIFPRETQSFCQQNYSPYTLYALDESRGCVVTEQFQIPSSCDCVIEKKDLLRGVTRDLLRKDRQ